MNYKLDDEVKLEAAEEVIDRFEQRYKQRLTLEDVSDVLNIQQEVITIGVIKGFHLFFYGIYRFTNKSISHIRRWHRQQVERLEQYKEHTHEDITDDLELLRKKRNSIIQQNEKALSTLKTKEYVSMEELRNAPIKQKYNNITIKIPEDCIVYNVE